LGHQADERDYTSAAQMLHALGASRIALLSNNPDKGAQLTRLGITIARQVPTVLHLTETNAAYLTAKARRGGHDLLSRSLERAAEPRQPWRLRPSSRTGRAAHEIKLVGDVDQLTRSQLPAAHGQPVGQVRRFHPILAAPQRVLDRAEDAAQEVSLILRVAPVRAGASDPVRGPCRQRGRPRSPQIVEQAAARSAVPGRPAVAKALIHVAVVGPHDPVVVRVAGREDALAVVIDREPVDAAG